MRIYPLWLGELTNDKGLAVSMNGMATIETTERHPVMCTQSMSAYVIVHPTHGPILYDTGVPPEREGVWPEASIRLASPSLYEDEHRLDVALNAAGFETSDIRAIIISHLHLDHAGGLELFRGMDVPVYVHEKELKSAFFNVATGQDFGPYLPHYLDHRFDWRPIYGNEFDLFTGIRLHRAAGHSTGLLMMQVEAKNTGNWLFLSDQFPLEENYRVPVPQGWIQRDHAAWWRSVHQVRSLEDRFEANLVYGHDKDHFAKLNSEQYYD